MSSPLTKYEKVSIVYWMSSTKSSAGIRRTSILPIQLHIVHWTECPWRWNHGHEPNSYLEGVWIGELELHKCHVYFSKITSAIHQPSRLGWKTKSPTPPENPCFATVTYLVLPVISFFLEGDCKHTPEAITISQAYWSDNFDIIITPCRRSLYISLSRTHPAGNFLQNDFSSMVCSLK